MNRNASRGGFGHGSGGEEPEEDRDDEEGDDDEDSGDDELQSHAGRRRQQSIGGASGGGNRFFSLDDKGESGSGRVYAAIEVPEPADDGAPGNADLADEPMIFECIDANWKPPELIDEGNWLEVYRRAPLYVLELPPDVAPSFPENATPGDIAWFEFQYKPASARESNARLYTSLYGRGSPVTISPGEPQSPTFGEEGRVAWLSKAFDERLAAAEPADVAGVLQRAFEDKVPSAGVAVYDVGQGACQALVDSSLHIPLLYVDFGGGVLYNRATFPKEFGGFCFTHNPPIVLSHWDWDHWSSAHRYAYALSTDWIAPPVPAKPIQRAVAAEMLARGRLHIWNAAGSTQLKVGEIRLERCTGRTENDSGIAVTFYAGRFRKRNCLLPGDAAYRYIPSVAAGESFNSLCMAHHGGRLHSKHYPASKRSSAAANSSGPRNSYKHPLFTTLAAHFDAGWPVPAQTGFSGQRPCHVLLPWGKQAHLFRGGCHGGMCSVAPTEFAPAAPSIKRMATPLPKVKKKAKQKILTSA